MVRSATENINYTLKIKMENPNKIGRLCQCQYPGCDTVL